MTRPTNLTWWTTEKNGSVQFAELGAGHITLDLQLGERVYAVHLTPSPEGPSEWRGTWIFPGGTGAITARLYRAADGTFALIGDWVEDASVYRWVAEFTARS